MPGCSTRMLEKAPNAGADVVFLDLEDAVAPDDKEQARENVIAALNEQDWSACSVSVRINGLDTHCCYRDIVEVVERAGDKLDTILIPKVGTPSDVEFVATLMSQIEAAHGLAPINLHILIETALGMANVEAIAQACPDRLEAMVFGVADYAASTQARTTNIGGANPEYSVLTDPAPTGSATAIGATSGTSPCRGWWSHAARMACGRSTGRSATTPIPTATCPPPAVARSSAARASGRSIRPRSRWQTSVFTPTDEEGAHARRILAAMEQAATEGKGAVSLDGR